MLVLVYFIGIRNASVDSVPDCIQAKAWSRFEKQTSTLSYGENMKRATRWQDVKQILNKLRFACSAFLIGLVWDHNMDYIYVVVGYPNTN